MFKRSLLLVVLMSVFVINSAHAQWVAWPHRTGTFTYRINGNLIGLWYGVQQYSQPTTASCGSTTIAMQMMWETHKKGRALRYDPMQVYNYINTDGQSGISTNELKSGIAKMVGHINQSQNLGLRVWMYERFNSDIKGAISIISNTMKANDSPVILYGNIKNGSAGGHYYLATGMINCPKGICSSDYFGLYINDSVYNSPAFPTSGVVGANAIPPRHYLNHGELETYWKKTGAFWGGHGYLHNGQIGV